MGVSNRARRAAKKRKRASRRPGGTSEWSGFAAADADPGGYGAFDERQVAAALVKAALGECRSDKGAATRHAAAFTGSGGLVPVPVIVETLDHVLASTVAAVLRGGWGPADLAEITRRRLTTQHLALLVVLLAAHAGRYPDHRVASEWRTELAAMGPGDAADLRTRTGMELALGVAAVLGTLPAVPRLIPPPGVPGSVPTTGTAADAKALARVRALLAKAESTDFPEEAEALSAKAQELISRYALDRLVAAVDDGAVGGDLDVVARRLWIDAPYVLPKATLIDVVAAANRCSSVLSEQLGFSTVVGAPADLDAVELLTTSLLVQASSALLRAGRRSARDGTSRTTSFRRSFLLSYATRIGERLRLADEAVTEGSAQSGVLVPLLRRHGERVTATVGEMFPETVHRATTVSNLAGWAEGRAAADLALFDTNLQVGRHAG